MSECMTVRMTKDGKFADIHNSVECIANASLEGWVLCDDVGKTEAKEEKSVKPSRNGRKK